MTELIAERDVLTMKIAAYKDIAGAASQTVYRARGTEIKIVSSITVSEWQRQIDRAAKELRTLDNLIQENNWKRELIEQ